MIITFFLVTLLVTYNTSFAGEIEPTCKRYFTETEMQVTPPTKACTREYMPVCAQTPMPACPEGMMCAQVMPQPKTYGNKCGAEAANAKIAYEWECINSKLEVKLQNSLTKALDKVPAEKQATLIEKVMKRIDVLLSTDNLSEFKKSSKVLKTLLQAY